MLFAVYFLLLWGGQLSSARAALELSPINLYLVPLYFCFFSRAAVWFIILKKMELIKAYTLSSINYLLIPFISYFVLGESFRIKHLIGGLFIITGIVLYRIGEQRPLRGTAGVASL